MRQSEPMKSKDNERLSTEEIEAILEKEATELPAESHERMKPVQLVAREMGEGKNGGVILWIVIIMMLVGVIQSMR